MEVMYGVTLVLPLNNNRFNLSQRGRHAFCSPVQRGWSFGKGRTGTPIRPSFPGQPNGGHRRAAWKLMSMRELEIQASNDTMGIRERTNMMGGFCHLMAELVRTVYAAAFNGQSLLARILHAIPILAQTAAPMLAQANQVPQGVLSSLGV